MRNDTHKWDPIDEATEVLNTESVKITTFQPERQVIVSGVPALKVTDLPLVSWPEPVTVPSYALVVRRDRVLEVNGPAREDGWHDDIECAVSDMSYGYAVFDIVGPGAFELLKRGMAITNSPSASVVRSAFGIGAMLYAHGGADSYRMHVGRAHGQSMRKMLVTYSQAMAD